jgi:DNA ligase-3
MTPIQPMLADACTFEKAVQKLGGTTRLVGEIKYDGERIQVHKTGNAFHYFTRNLKTADEKKIENLAACIRQALPHARDLILDGELLLIDRSGIPLPFGTLGCHKKKEFADATVCYVIFDCLFINGKSLLATPLWKRREMLQENVTEIRGRVQLSEQVPIESEEVLHNYWRQAIDAKLEGIVLKDANASFFLSSINYIAIIFLF